MTSLPRLRNWNRDRCFRDQAPADQRDKAVGDFIDLVVAVDGILQQHATADAAYFATACCCTLPDKEALAIERHFLKAYRWQYIFSGAGHSRFQRTLRA